MSDQRCIHLYSKCIFCIVRHFLTRCHIIPSGEIVTFLSSCFYCNFRSFICIFYSTFNFSAFLCFYNNITFLWYCNIKFRYSYPTIIWLFCHNFNSPYSLRSKTNSLFRRIVRKCLILCNRNPLSISRIFNKQICFCYNTARRICSWRKWNLIDLITFIKSNLTCYTVKFSFNFIQVIFQQLIFFVSAVIWMPVCFRFWVKRHLERSFISDICMSRCRFTCPSGFIMFCRLRYFCRNNDIINYRFNGISLWTDSLKWKQKCRDRNSFFSRLSFQICLSVSVNSCSL